MHSGDSESKNPLQAFPDLSDGKRLSGNNLPGFSVELRIHRDLKPENIMLVQREGQDDFVKVLDFGLALVSRQLSAEGVGDEHSAKTAPKITQAGEIFGTPSYMAPEQSVSSATDIRTDLYALGILIYEMLTGLRPFVGKNVVAIIQQQLATPPPPMKQRAPNVQIPADMEALVKRLMEKLPEHRYQTPDELIAAIDQIGATHELGWPGSASASNPAVAAALSGAGVAAVSGSMKAPEDRQRSHLTLRLHTMRTHLSSRLHRLRTLMLAPPPRRSKLGQVIDAIQQKFDPQRRLEKLPLWLLSSGAALAFGIVFGIIWLAIGA